jgi:hypothetical protein
MSPAIAKARAFLAAYRVLGCVTLAAAAVPIDKSIHYRWLKNPRYARDFAEAQREFADVLEACAIGRAKDGVLEPIFYQGEPCGAIRKFSDGLMVHLLKRFNPESYGQKITAELSGPGGGPVEVRSADLAALSNDELADLRQLALKVALAAAGDRAGDQASPEAED